ncbi:MAG: dihydroorotate dehydrogenase [Thermoplasmatota archaeon]
MARVEDVDFGTKVNGVSFANPLLLASGILDETGASMARALREGAGGVVTKSMSLRARPGHTGPNVVEVEGGLLNAMGLPGPGLDHFAEEVAQARRAGGPLVGSVFGGTAQEFSEAASRMAALGTPILELNVSCPHAKGYGSEIGSDPGRLEEVVRAVKDAVRVPIWVKLTPNTDDVVRLARVAVQAGADGLVCTNTLKAIAIEPDVRRPSLGYRVGGLSGHALKPVALRAVWDCHQAALGVPLIASGGIYGARDVLEYAMAGATLFQVGTALMHEGWGLFRHIQGDLARWLAAEGLSGLSAVRGAAHGEA